MKFKHGSKLQTTNQKLSGFKFILFCKMDQWDLMRDSEMVKNFCWF